MELNFHVRSLQLSLSNVVSKLAQVSGALNAHLWGHLCFPSLGQPHSSKLTTLKKVKKKLEQIKTQLTTDNSKEINKTNLKKKTWVATQITTNFLPIIQTAFQMFRWENKNKSWKSGRRCAMGRIWPISDIWYILWMSETFDKCMIRWSDWETKEKGQMRNH